MYEDIIERLRERVIDTQDTITFDEALELAYIDDNESLLAALQLSSIVTSRHHKSGVYLCSITSAKTGACPEDCAFCGQSVFSESPVMPSVRIEPSNVLDSAVRAETCGASEFCIVISGRGPDKRTFEKVLECVRLIKTVTGLSVGCSLGILTEEQARLLALEGVSRYNHNLETSRSFFPKICTTHTYEDRLRTAVLVKKHGINLCCGGIMGIGETHRERVELAFELKALEPQVVPINFLDPRPGTSLGTCGLLPPLEALKFVALFRLVLPKSILLCAGGRETVLRDYQSWALYAGANALIMGNYLTTKGNNASNDTKMLRDMGLPVLRYG